MFRGSMNATTVILRDQHGGHLDFFQMVAVQYIFIDISPLNKTEFQKKKTPFTFSGPMNATKMKLRDQIGGHFGFYKNGCWKVHGYSQLTS